MFVLGCGTTVHQNTCKDNIQECAKKNAKVFVILVSLYHFELKFSMKNCLLSCAHAQETCDITSCEN